MIQLLIEEREIVKLKFENEVIDFEEVKAQIKEIYTQIDIKSCEFINCEFKNIQSKKAPNFQNCKFYDCKFEYVELVFKFCKFENCKFENLGESTIESSKIEKTKFKRTLKELTIDDCDIKTCDFIYCSIKMKTPKEKRNPYYDEKRYLLFYDEKKEELEKKFNAYKRELSNEEIEKIVREDEELDDLELRFRDSYTHPAKLYYVSADIALEIFFDKNSLYHLKVFFY